MKKTQKIIIYIILGIIVLGIIGGVAYLATPTPVSHYATATVSPMNITEVVTGTGQVQPDEESVLAFDGNGGTIATVNVQDGDSVKQGEVLGTLESDILNASLQSAQAGVAAAQAQLNSLEVGAAPADVAVYTQKTSDAETALSSALHDSYLKTQDAVENQINSLFNNPGSANPTIAVYTANQATAASIDNEYISVIGNLATWQSDINSDASSPTITVSTQTESDASTTLASAKTFMADLAAVTAQLNTNNSGLTQTQINTDRTTVNTAASEVTAAISEYTSALSAYADATASLTLEQSSSTPDTLETQQAQVAAAQAQVTNIQAQIAHTVITAPFDGVITDSEPKVGEVFAAGTPAFTIMSNGVYKVEVYVSETDVAKLTVGDPAEISLDAYGSGTLFPATVTAIDPAETTDANGVSTYKVTLHFTQQDPRILSGMTANVSIDAGYAGQVIAVPSSAIVTQGADTYVLVQNSKGAFVEQLVQTGITGNNASSTSDTNTYIQIESGLSQGDVIASFGTSAGQ
jgi:RND family efflux transporter MFP subunit